MSVVYVNLQLIAQAMPSRHTFFKALANGHEAMDDKVNTFAYFNYNSCITSTCDGFVACWL